MRGHHREPISPRRVSSFPLTYAKGGSLGTHTASLVSECEVRRGHWIESGADQTCHRRLQNNPTCPDRPINELTVKPGHQIRDCGGGLTHGHGMLA